MDLIDIAVQGPRFANIVENKLYHCIIEGLFVQFFPESVKANAKEPYNKEDVVFFMKFANDEVPLIQELPSQPNTMQGQTYDSINLSQFKSFLDRILSRGWTKDRKMLKPLNLYKFEV